MTRSFQAAWLSVLALLLAAPSRSIAESMFDLSREKVLYCVGYAHLDTQWRWDFRMTIDRYIEDTLLHNFERFEKYPGYVFSFTGSVRYEMMKEYYPEHYERLKDYVAAGRWFVSGSSVDEGDVNVPSAEAVIRQVLYGNQFFRREFGKESVDFMLPDCFGFPASMPSIWAHCGLKGFSTQKLTWGSAMGIPFKIGVWEGLDGRGVIAAFDPGSYATGLDKRVDTNPAWLARVEANGRKYGIFADYHYYGIGDQGGAPREEHIANYLASIDQPDSPMRVALTSSDQMFKDITPKQRGRLPRYRGDLLLTEHSAGTLTSQATMKRWNRKNEQLADAAERAAVTAHWLNGAKYPRQKLYQSWVRVLANQMHDILPGTSIPRAYRYSWNDEVVAMNGFAAVLTDAIGGIVQIMDTRAEGWPVLVYNPLEIGRADLVEAEVRCGAKVPAAVRVYDATGREVPSQVLGRGEDSVRVLFAADVMPVSYTVYDVRAAETPYADDSPLRVDEQGLESEHYRIRLDANGDVASIRDKGDGDREILAGPARLVFTPEKPRQYPAWNMDWADRTKPAVGAFAGPARVRIREAGPLRVALEIERAAEQSVARQQIRLTRGDAGRRIAFVTRVDWQSTGCALRAAFPLTVRNPKAVYNWEIGTIERGNNEPTKYEVPTHQWLDVTEPGSGYGVSVLDDCKYGSDKPDDHLVRLTLLYTPAVRESFMDQHSQDWGIHDFQYALYPHRGDWRAAGTAWQARRFNQQLVAFQVPAHAGAGLGRSLSLLQVNTPQVGLHAVKLAEDADDRVIVRLQELWGRRAQGAVLSCAVPIADAFEVDGQERRIGDASLDGEGRLRVDFAPYRPRSFSLRLGAPPARSSCLQAAPLRLAFDLDVISADADRADGRFDDAGRSLPAEQIPATITSEGVPFDMGSGEPGQRNALRCKGQSIDLPPEADHVYLLLAATEDTSAAFAVGAASYSVEVPAWTGFLGQWDDRIWDRAFDTVDFRGEGKVVGFKPGFIKRVPWAWFCTHRHHPEDGNEAYQFCYLFKQALPTGGATTLTLPDNEAIRILAVTAAIDPGAGVTPAQPLYDDLDERPAIALRHVYPPPPVAVHEGRRPVGEVVLDRQASFEALVMGAPRSGDFVDRSSGQDVEFGYTSGDGAVEPHWQSGAVDGRFPRLNDGAVSRHDDDTERSVWYDGEGRFHVDLQADRRIARVNTYSWHRSNRAPQVFSLWGATGSAMPPADFAHGEHGAWELIAVVDSNNLGKGGVHGSSVTGRDGALGPYRYLLWIAEDRGQGTFFTEIDIDVQP